MDTEDIMFDFSGFYDKVAEWMPAGCRVAEIGVADGHSALYLAKKLVERSKSFKLYMIDNMNYGGYEQMKTIYQNIIKSGLGEWIEVIPYDSLAASNKFNDDYLDFAFIDSSHDYLDTWVEIQSWYRKIKDLGYLAGHDYYLYSNHVGRAVDEVIPKEITRNDIPHRQFPPEQFLYTEQTERNYGIWYCQKDFYKHLNK